MAYLMKVFPCKYEDPSLYPYTHKKPGVEVCFCKLIAGEVEIGRSLDLTG